MLPLFHPFALLQSGLLTQQRWTRHSLRWLAEATPPVTPASAEPRMSPVAPQPEPAPARRASPQTASRRRAR